MKNPIDRQVPRTNKSSLDFPGAAIVCLAATLLAVFTTGCGSTGWKVVGCALVPEESTDANRTVTRCYTDWKYRDASALSDCPGADKSGLLCYPPCRDGYDGVGPVCWQKCPPGYHDDGAFCRRDVQIIGANNDACPWYDKCGLTFASGCSTCPPGFHNDGCTCRIDADIFAKDNYWRGVGTPMSCPPGKQQIGGLCYGACPPGYTANGIYCNANQETCKEVPVQPTPDYAALKQFCFVVKFPDSWARPCITVSELADTEENAKKLAQCECQGQNCTIDKIDCNNLSTECSRK
jgi:hypothetical protein